MTVEAAALEKTVEEKTAALKPLNEAQEAAKPPVDAALAKLAPLKKAMGDAEKALLAARRKAAADAQSLAALDRKMHTAQSMSLLPEQSQTIIAAEKATEQREAELEATRQQLAEYAVVIARSDAALQAATESMSAAVNAVNIAAADYADRKALADAVSAAMISVETAAQKAAEDPILADVTEKLKVRSNIARAELEKAQSQMDAAANIMTTATEVLTAAQTSVSQANAERTQLEASVAATTDSLSAAKADLANRQSELSSVVSELDDSLVKDFTAASLKPLSPEQLCWSVFRVTGVYDQYWQAEVAELDKTNPVTEEQKLDSAFLAARRIELEQKTFDKLKGNVATFVTFYGAAAGQPQGDFFSTADQALFTANAGSINSWVAPANGNVTDRVIRQTDPRLAAEELYLGVLTRMPTEDEVKEVTNHLVSRVADRNVAAQELVWAVLNSAEFRFNH